MVALGGSTLEALASNSRDRIRLFWAQTRGGIKMLTREEMVQSGQRITALLRDHRNPAGGRPVSAKHLARFQELKDMYSSKSETVERRVAFG
jgi:hypothetical protein